MDDEQKFDPVTPSTKEDIRPGFVGGKGGGETPSGMDTSKNEDHFYAANKLKDAEESASEEAPKSDDTLSGARDKEEGGGFYSRIESNIRNKKTKKKGLKGSFTKALPIIFISCGVLIIGAILLIIPLFNVGTIDYNLQDTLGYTDTEAILEKQAEYITKEALLDGEVPKVYAQDLAVNGIDVGQITASGDFVKTNVYIADIEKLREIASNDRISLKKNDPGQLAIMFDGEIIAADDFVNAVESDPKMYAAYSKAANISARYYYSDEVAKVYKDIGASRNSFGKWEEPEDWEKGKEEFDKILLEALDSDSSRTVSGCKEQNDDCDANESFSEEISTGGDAKAAVKTVAEKTKGNDATQKASSLLNAAISSNEPYKATKSFVTVEEVLQRARIQGDGPINYMMDALSEETEISYTDVKTGDEVKEKKSILSTQNFSAAASGGGFSKDEANNFSRDRVLIATDSTDEEIVGATSVASDGNSKGSLSQTFNIGDSADSETVEKATSSVEIGITKDTSETFKSSVGGNRIVEGGSFLSNTINSRVIGASPSDAKTIAEYQHEVDKVIARKAKADQYTLSPFDVSSPHTFLGSIVHNFSAALIKNQLLTSNNFSVMPTMSAASTIVQGSIDKMLDTTLADGKSAKYTATAGDCTTVKIAANVEGDLYCNSHNTVSTKYMSNTRKDWDSQLGNDLSDSGSIDEEGKLAEFITLGMDRESTVGVKSSDVCERWKDIPSNQGVFSKITDALTSVVGLYKSCRGIDPEIANGSRYTLSNKNEDGDWDKERIEKYSGYVLYDTVSSLLSQEKSNVSRFKDTYYAAHPKDNTLAGRIARISGMSKKEAEIALAYANYLTYLAKYDPTEKYKFGEQTIPEAKIFFHTSDATLYYYALLIKKNKYNDLRNRNYVA